MHPVPYGIWRKYKNHLPRYPQLSYQILHILIEDAWRPAARGPECGTINDQSTCIKNTRPVLGKEVRILDEFNVARKVSRLHLGNLPITLGGSTKNKFGTAGSYKAAIDLKSPGHQDIIT